MPGLRRPADMFDNFAGDLRWMTANVDHGVCTFVFHPQVIGRGHRMLALEAWLDEIADLGLTSPASATSPPPTSTVGASGSSRHLPPDGAYHVSHPCSCGLLGWRRRPRASSPWQFIEAS